MYVKALKWESLPEGQYKSYICISLYLSLLLRVAKCLM